jgi:hypothetical protein
MQTIDRLLLVAMVLAVLVALTVLLLVFLLRRLRLSAP